MPLFSAPDATELSYLVRGEGEPASWSATRSGTRRARCTGSGPGARAALATLAVPVLVLAGEYDGGPAPERCAQLARLLPGAGTAVQEAAGHFPWVDDPDAFRRTVTGFLDGPAAESRAVTVGGE
ncbi:alpha/beta hydrolase [Streptomyces sp. NPDC001941]|uniref:alpha/beta fold hydrolase n=1 Tax=Streptomyces sp. NPDC001941 TaxID=3154659 RepID=UPI0033319AF0